LTRYWFEAFVLPPEHVKQHGYPLATRSTMRAYRACSLQTERKEDGGARVLVAYRSRATGERRGLQLVRVEVQP
jgi:hypothetical protein